MGEPLFIFFLLFFSSTVIPASIFILIQQIETNDEVITSPNDMSCNTITGLLFLIVSANWAARESYCRDDIYVQVMKEM